VIGHSMGGVLATLIAERVPVRGVVNVEGNLSRGDCGYSGRAAAQPLADFVSHGFDALRADVQQRGVLEPALRSYHTALCAAGARTFHRHATDLVALSETETLAARLAALTVPVLYIAGVPAGICERSHALLREHQVPWVGLEPAGHWPFIDQSDAFAAAVAAFAREV
jgi:pimeloyl-ACP methyl ester carboxylesterase